MWSLISPRAKRISGPEKFRSSTQKDFCNKSAHLGHGAMSDLRQQCAQERTSLRGFALAADRLQQHRVPVEIQELLLAAGDRAQVDGFRSVDPHRKKGGVMGEG